MAAPEKERLREALRRTVSSGDLENVKRVADSLHEAGYNPVAELSSLALNDSVTPAERQVALRALESLDSAALKLVERIRSSGGTLPTGMPEPSREREARPLPDPGRTLIFGLLIALAILWPAYSVYRFNNPRPQKPLEPELPWTDQQIEFESLTACRSAIRQQLRDPDSADFPFLEPASFEASYSGRVAIKGYLHANNGLGLKVRVDYLCDVQADRQARTVSVLSAQLLQR